MKLTLCIVEIYLKNQVMLVLLWKVSYFTAHLFSCTDYQNVLTLNIMRFDRRSIVSLAFHNFFF